MAVSNARIPFEEVIAEPLLLKKAWLRLSRPQQTALKIFYGLPLEGGELDDYAMFMGHATFDSLGFVTSVDRIPYDAKEHDEAVAIFGRRSAKTSNFLSFIAVYEALLGGHMAFASAKQEVVTFVVAQKLDVAQAIIRDFIEPLVSSSPLLEKEISGQNTEGIRFKNKMRIAPAPPSVKAFRYYAIPVAIIDEAAFYYKDAESANPDYEVIRAIEPAQAQFPDKKLVVASTIWSKQGIVWEAKEAGSYGVNLPEDDERKAQFEHTLVLQAPTPAMQNPLLQPKWFERQQKKDPDAYAREVLNTAADQISGMFTEEMMRRATADQPKSRECFKIVKGENGIEHCEPEWYYVAALDPAFRGDDFAFAIGHYEPNKGFVQDVLKTWTPKFAKLSPANILDEIKVDLERFHIQETYSDQYQLEALQQLALDRGFTIVGMDFTANSKSKMFGSFLQLLRNDRIHLLRHHDQFQQFILIQKFIGHGGYIRVSAPVGKHDDMVMVTVLCAFVAIRFIPPESEAKVKPLPTPFESIMASIEAQKQQKSEWL
jgi:hypothetical protein